MDSDKYSMADFKEYDDIDIFKKTDYFYEYSKDYINKKYYTFFRTLLTQCSPRVLIKDRYSGKKKEMIMLASNNYLGITIHPKVIEAGGAALKKYGSGLCGSPLLCGYSQIHKDLEMKLAEFKSCEDAMIFPSGFATNLGTITALLRKNDVIILDRLNHASIIDGALFSGAQFRTFKHNDLDDLERILKACKDKGKMIIAEGVYSMDGDLSPLKGIKILANKYNARLMVDEAHATGVLGENGKGSVEFHDMEGTVDIIMGTFSKSLGAMGGFICSTKKVINYIRFYARSYFFSASLSPVVIACVKAAINIIKLEPELRIKLWSNIKYLKNNLKSLGFNIGNSNSAIIPIIIGDDILLRKMAVEIHEKGLFLNSVFFPAVQKDSARIRLSVMATLNKKDLDDALNILENVGRKNKII